MANQNSSALESNSGNPSQTRNWDWLQSRLDQKAQLSELDSLREWITSELDALEDEFEHLVTAKSRSRNVAQQLKSER